MGNNYDVPVFQNTKWPPHQLLKFNGEHHMAQMGQQPGWGKLLFHGGNIHCIYKYRSQVANNYDIPIFQNTEWASSSVIDIQKVNIIWTKWGNNLKVGATYYFKGATYLQINVTCGQQL